MTELESLRDEKRALESANALLLRQTDNFATRLIHWSRRSNETIPLVQRDGFKERLSVDEAHYGHDP